MFLGTLRLKNYSHPNQVSLIFLFRVAIYIFLFAQPCLVIGLARFVICTSAREGGLSRFNEAQHCDGMRGDRRAENFLFSAKICFTFAPFHLFKRTRINELASQIETTFNDAWNKSNLHAKHVRSDLQRNLNNSNLILRRQNNSIFPCFHFCNKKS